MKQYLFVITATYTHKNKLYEAFSDHVHKLDGTLITGEDTLRAFRRSLLEKLEQLHKEFPRCKPIELLEYKVGHSLDPKAETNGFAVSGSWTANLYAAQRYLEMKDNHLQYYIPSQDIYKTTI